MFANTHAHTLTLSPGKDVKVKGLGGVKADEYSERK